MTRLLNRGNDELISATLSALDLQRDDRYLDVGFGGGVSFEKAGRVVEASMLGVDPSREAVAGTRERLAELVQAGRLELGEGGCEDPPVEPSSVDKLLSTNTVYFWPNLDAGLRGCARCLAPGGRLAIGLTQREKMSRFSIADHGFRKYDGVELIEPLRAAGFEKVAVVRLYSRVTEGDAVVVGTRS